MIDATCPLVTKVHLEAVRFARDGFSIVLIGHKDHDEVIGTLGEVPERSYLVETVEDVDRLELPDPTRVRYLTQTTLSLDETRDIVDAAEGAFSADSGAAGAGHLLCHREPADGGEGSLRSSSICCWWSVRRTARTPSAWWKWGDNFGVAVVSGERPHDVDTAWLEGVSNVGVTAGASAPEHLVRELIEFLRE